MRGINLCCCRHTHMQAHRNKQVLLGEASVREHNVNYLPRLLFLELIISFYVIHLSVVIVCQSNAVAAWYEVEYKFCLGKSSLCTKRRWPRCRIYIYNYSHDTIISHHNSSAQDVNSDREQALHSAYQTAAWQAWHHASGPVIYTMQPRSLPRSRSLSVSLSFCAPLILNVCLLQCLCPCNSCCLSVLVSWNTKHAHLTGAGSSLSVV